MTQSAVPAKKVLIVDDEEGLRDIYSAIFEDLGYKTWSAPDGKTAQSMFAIEKFDLVLSDIKMPGQNASGIDLLHFIRRKSEIPVILMTGFSEILEVKQAFEIGASGFLSKPFTHKELTGVLDSIPSLNPKKEQDESAEETQEEYCKISIDDFISGKEIRYNIFVRVSPEHYVKVAHQGEDLSLDRIRAYKERGIRHLYLRSQDFNNYIGFNLNLSKLALASPKISRAKKLNLIKHTGEIILERFNVEMIDAASVDAAKVHLENTVSALSQSTELFELLSLLKSHSDHAYAHSVGVSFYSVLMAKELGWHTPQSLFKLSFAGMLHEIGTKEISPLLISKPRSDMNPDEIRLYQKHPVIAAEILGRIPTVTSDVLQVILQHHENCAGTGFPGGLKKDKIHPMARLLAVADEFCDLVLDSPNCAAMPPAQALERLSILSNGVLDPAFMKPLFQLFNRAGVKNGERIINQSGSS